LEKRNALFSRLSARERNEWKQLLQNGI
jgi:hypothetical protein